MHENLPTLVRPEGFGIARIAWSCFRPALAAGHARRRGRGGSAARLRAGLAGPAATAASDLRPQDARWQDHFSTCRRTRSCATPTTGCCTTGARDGFYRMYPTSVPINGEMTRRGRTTVTLKRPDPDWRPTENMLQRNPDLPRYVEPGPEQPARRPRAQPRVSGRLPHPRHQRHPQDRAAVLQRLHRPFQRAHHRGVRPRPGRNAGVANMTTDVFYSPNRLSRLKGTRESWLGFRPLACPIAGPGGLAASQTRTL
jgi:hypothetical protein